MVLLFGLIYGVVFVSSNNDEVFAESITSSNSNASLTITENDLHTTAAPGSIAYTSTNIGYSTTNVENYTLKISYANGSSALVGDSADATNISDITNNTLSDNSWGYAWSDDNSIAESNFSNLTYFSIPSYNNGNNLTSGSTNISNGTGKLIFAAKFAGNAVTTNYKTPVLLALATTPKAVTYTITYNSDGGTAVSSTTKTSTNTAETLTISSATPTKTGYDFVNWKDSSNNTYNPGNNITITYTNPSITLTAVWKEKITIKSITQMQQMTPEICNATAISDSTTLTDTRDNRTYTVRKLNDGKCWMTSNLQLNLSVAKIATAADSDNLSADYPTVALASRWNTATDNAWVEFDANEQFSINPQNIAEGSTSYRYAYGYYYSWCAATAGTCRSLSSTTIDNEDASGSICPKGWQLPSGKYGTGVNDFAVMAGLSSIDIVNSNYWTSLTSKTYGSDSFVVNGSSWLAAGNVGSNGYNGGTGGFYWSRTTTAYDSANVLNFNNNVFIPAARYHRFCGFSIRCIAK